jgi:hypothetical protein
MMCAAPERHPFVALCNAKSPDAGHIGPAEHSLSFPPMPSVKPDLATPRTRPCREDPAEPI